MTARPSRSSASWPFSTRWASWLPSRASSRSRPCERGRSVRLTVRDTIDTGEARSTVTSYSTATRCRCSSETSGHEQRLVVDEQLEDHRVGDGAHRLARSREAVGLLGVDDRPRLVEAVDERAGVERGPSLVQRSSDTDVTVRERERRLGPVGELGCPAGLDDPPLVGREEMLGGRHDLAFENAPTVTTDRLVRVFAGWRRGGGRATLVACPPLVTAPSSRVPSPCSSVGRSWRVA